MSRDQAFARVLVVVLAFDVLWLALGVARWSQDPWAPGHGPTAPWVFGRSWLGLGGVAVVGVAASVAGWRRGTRDAVRAACLALLVGCVALVVAAHDAVVPTGFHGRYFFAGAAAAGWLTGFAAEAAAARLAPGEGPAGWASAGAMAGLAVPHLASAVSRILYLEGWAFEPWVIQLSLHMDHPAGAVSCLEPAWRSIAERPAWATALSVGTWLGELSAAALAVGGRARALWVPSLLTYHAVMGALFGLPSWEAIALVLAFGAAAGGGAFAPRPRLGVPSRLVAAAALVGGAAALVPSPCQPPANTNGGPSNTPPAELTGPPPTVPTDVPVPRLGPWTVGEAVGDGWTVLWLGVQPAHVRMGLVASDGGRVALDLMRDAELEPERRVQTRGGEGADTARLSSLVTRVRGSLRSGELEAWIQAALEAAAVAPEL